MTIKEYLEIVSKRLQSGISSEHSFRGDLETLIRALVPGIEITNEPANITDCGNPDYVITRGKIPVGYIEAKDIGKDLNSKSYKEQFGRYKKALDNLIITDYIWFQFFQNGELVHDIKIGEIVNNAVKPIPENFSKFENLIKDFSTHIGQTIKSSKKLAEMMAGKARLLQDILERAITSDEETQENTSLRGQYDTFKQILIHDLKPKDFADIYAQTLAYGMFAARLHDPTLNDFSRQEAAELIPKSNPFLRKLFGYIAGPDIDERIVTVVDNLAEVFRATNVEQLLHNFGKATQMHDPIIHFYETFLAEYDPKLRKARGVWYTPEPVVNFIVRAVDDILKTEFNLPQGLADTSKTTIKIKTVTKATSDKRSKLKEVEETREVHKVQLLDPATGTGTFLAQVVKHIYNTNFKAMQGAWSGYVEEHLIPRLNGFELLMASYAMAHLKLDMLLRETGYDTSLQGTHLSPRAQSRVQQRLNIFLTNSLEPETGEIPNLFMSQWLTEEAVMADVIKRDTPVMCVIGNPPYAVSSTNKGKWIQGLLNDYKKDLNERKINLDDDYIKFIRYGQHYIEKNGEGILAYISNNSFIDGITHRQMRKNLLETFDKIYILDLHGNAKKKETAPDGSADQNVFDIMQGVSINIFVKTKNKTTNKLGEVHHFDLYGKRDFKYPFLSNNSMASIKWQRLDHKAPYFFFVPKDFEAEEKYNTGFKINEILINNNTGIQTKCDALSIHFEKESLKKVVDNFKTKEIKDLKSIYSFKKDSSGWNFKNAKSDLLENNIHFSRILYRPFDIRFTLYTGKSSGFIGRPRTSIMRHIVDKDNLGFITLRINGENEEFVSLITNHIIEKGSLPRGNYSIFPLYLYPENEEQQTIEKSSKRTPNLKLDIVNQIAAQLGLAFVPDHEPSVIANVVKQSVPNNKIATSPTTGHDRAYFTPVDLLDYIYAVLHSPTYREKYKEFLKIDFPRVPYPKDAKTFWELVALGAELRQIHLLESPKVEAYITSYPEAGDNSVTRKMTKNSPGFEAVLDTFSTSENTRTDVTSSDLRGTSELYRDAVKGKVWINDTQYFNNVPLVAWEFYIGGYQPAQKWLKDRYGRQLQFEDILHYQKIIVALTETDRLMKAIDLVTIE